MIFTRVGIVIAWLMVALGAFRVAAGLAGNPRYLGASPPGEVIDQGLMTIALAVALGILCEISRSVSPRS